MYHPTTLLYTPKLIINEQKSLPAKAPLTVIRMLQPLKPYLQKCNPIILTLYMTISAFATYFCVYTYRKPVFALVYKDMKFFGMDFKTSLTLAQTMGLVLSKIIGIKYVSELKRDNRRAFYFLVLVMISQAGNILFAILPETAKPLGIFINGLPLGCLWGYDNDDVLIVSAS